MDEQTYRRRLREVLDPHTDAAATRLGAIATAIRDLPVRGVVVDVFCDQDGEGTFDVWARLDGPDLFALNRAVDDHRHLFGVVQDEEGVEPEVPSFGARGAPFELEPVLVDVVAGWIADVWGAAVGEVSVPWEVGSPEGYGDTRLLGAPA